MTKRGDLRVQVMERAGGRCEFPNCTLPGSLDMAHLTASGMGGSQYRDTLENCAALCRLHHDWLDCRITPNARRFENEVVLRAALDRQWLGRR